MFRRISLHLRDPGASGWLGSGSGIARVIITLSQGCGEVPRSYRVPVQVQKLQGNRYQNLGYFIDILLMFVDVS